MSQILSYTICLVIIILSITGSVKKALKRRNVNFSLNKAIYYLSIFISILLIYLKLDKILVKIVEISTISLGLEGIYSDICKISLLVVLFFAIQLILYKLLDRILLPIFSKINKRNSVLLSIVASILGVTKAVILLLIMFVVVIIYNNTIGDYNNINIFSENKIYTRLSDVLEVNANKVTEEIVEDFLPASNVIVYYNGVTLEEGIKSNDRIDSIAKELTNNVNNDLDKARIIYSWIGNNLDYDYERAKKALNNENIEDSGAITAFENRSGICFDYSCLYVAMARAVGLKVRLLIGTAYDGIQYGPHSWNEVYISEIEKWVPVDTTFYLAGDYFNNDDFYEDHITESIAGEW